MQGWRQWLDQVLARRAPLSDRLTLNRKTVYILPSKFGWLLIAILVIMLLTAINYQNSLIFGLCFWLLSVFAVLIWHTWRNLAGLELRVGSETEAFVGEWSEIETLLTTTRRQHYHTIQLMWRDGVSHPSSDSERISSAPVDVLPNEVTHTSMSFKISHRGWNVTPRLEVFTRYPLGILTAWSVIRLPHKVLGYPKPLFDVMPQALDASVDAEESSEARQRSSASGHDFDSLSPYVEGDSLRKVDWKRYAKTDDLVTKTFVSSAAHDEWLLFDQFSALPLEHRLSALAGWVIAWTQEERRFGLKLPTETLDPNVGQAHQRACLRALALFQAESGQGQNP